MIKLSFLLALDLSYHQIETIWIFRSFLLRHQWQRRVAFEISRLLSFLFFVIFCFCLTAQAVITRCILVTILWRLGRISKLGFAISMLEDNWLALLVYYNFFEYPTNNLKTKTRLILFESIFIFAFSSGKTKFWGLKQILKSAKNAMEKKRKNCDDNH
jgi:hypothetical protein